MNKQKIFISYSRTDASNFALKLANDLRTVGANVWIDQLNIQPSQRWDAEVHKALVEANCLLFIATSASVVSENVLDEVSYTLTKGKRVIPILAANCELPFRTARLQYIDFTKNYGEGLKALLAVLGIGSEHIKGQNQRTGSAIEVGKQNEDTTAHQIGDRGTMNSAFGSCLPILIIAVVLFFIFLLVIG